MSIILCVSTRNMLYIALLYKYVICCVNILYYKILALLNGKLLLFCFLNTIFMETSMKELYIYKSQEKCLYEIKSEYDFNMSNTLSVWIRFSVYNRKWQNKSHLKYIKVYLPRHKLGLVMGRTGFLDCFLMCSEMLQHLSIWILLSAHCRSYIESC